VDGEAMGERMLRYLWVVAAVLVVLIATGTGQRDAGASESPYDSEELRFVELINQYREDHGVGPLLLSDTLSVASERHSRDMADYGFFAHHTIESSYYPAGSRAWDRMRAEGYDYNTLMGENIAVGCESAESCFELWRNSPAHNAAMLDGSYRVMGIGRVYGENSIYGWYWTTDFGATVDPTSHTPGESTPAEEANEPPQDGPGIESGRMERRVVWQQEAKDNAELILIEGDGYARLGDYDNGRDELWQKVRIGENSELSYRIKIESTEVSHPSDYLAVQLKDRQGERLAILKRYTDEDAGGEWRRESVDLSRFAGRRVYLSFLMETNEFFSTAFYLDDVTLREKKGE
jgi:uncharacterized protein YkwD